MNIHSTKGRGRAIAAFSVFLVFLVSGLWAGNAYFAAAGGILEYRGEGDSKRIISTPKKAGECFGFTSTGNIVAGLGEKKIEAGYDIRSGYELVLLSPAGDIVMEIARDVLRAYPAPAGNLVAFIDVHHNPMLFTGDEVENLPFQQKVIQFAWLPDSSGFIYTGKPFDWSPVKMNNPENTEEFLRLADSNLFLYKLKTGTITQLTTHPREDWNPAVSPDGKSVLFQSSRVSHSCFWMVNIEGTRVWQVTVPRPELKYDENIPIAYTDQLFWNSATGSIIYGTSRPDSTKEIREMRPDGSGARILARGRNPQIMNAGKSVAFQTEEGVVQSLKLK